MPGEPPLITAFYGSFNSSNIFHVQSGSHAFLVDAGMQDTAESLVSEIENGSLPRPEAVVLTHRHIDHVAGLAIIKSALDIPVFAERTGAEALNRGDTISTAAALFGIPLPEVTITPLIILQEGAELPPFLEGFAVFRTPGHSEDSIVLFHRETRSLFSGDTVFADGGVGRWDLPTGSLPDLVRSISFLKTLNVGALYPGHGRYLSSGGKFHIEDSYRAIEAYI